MRSNASALPERGDFRTEAWRGAPERFRVGQTRQGVWWWVTPEDVSTVVRGVQGVQLIDGSGGLGQLAALEDWGFNLLGPGSTAGFAGRGMAHVDSLELRRAEHPLIHVGAAQLPDVYDLRWPAVCAARVAAVNAGPGLAAYLSDRQLGWAQPPQDGSAPTRPTLLQLCLSLDPRFAAYHAAWEFVLAPRGGDWDALNRAWSLTLPNKETLRQQTLEEQPITSPGYLLDHARFTREFAQRYFRGAATAVRQTDPGRLFLGAPVAASLPGEIRDAAIAQVDVLLTDAVFAVSLPGPVLIVDEDWTSFADAPTAESEWGLSRLERMHRAGRTALLENLVHPAVIGYVWRTYVAGPRASEAPFGGGLYYADGSTAHEYVEPLAAINAIAEAVHAGGDGAAGEP